MKYTKWFKINLHGAAVTQFTCGLDPLGLLCWLLNVLGLCPFNISREFVVFTDIKPGPNRPKKYNELKQCIISLNICPFLILPHYQNIVLGIFLLFISNFNCIKDVYAIILS